jgi:hypothetical protein
VCGGAEAFAVTTALVIGWGRTYLPLHRPPGIKKDLLLSKRSRPFLVTFSGEAEKVTARRVGAFAVNRRAAESLFQTQQSAPHREHLVPASSFASKRTPPTRQSQSNYPKSRLFRTTPHPAPNRELFVPASSFPYKSTPTPPQSPSHRQNSKYTPPHKKSKTRQGSTALPCFL